MLARLRRLMPSPQALAENRWLRWLGPALHHPRLWHMSRRGIALGVAIGVFFGLLIPIAQIPASAAVAVALRANLPCAMASTLVTNPITFPPVYYAAWKVGGLVLGDDAPPPDRQAAAAQAGVAADDVRPWPLRAWDAVTGVGKPLVVGLAIFAVFFGLAIYLLVGQVWRARVCWKRRQRLRRAPTTA
jgi:uncharacterized protein (DUF2062 family)